MAASQRLICAADALPERGEGMRFEIARGGERVPAFAVRCGGTVYAYVNRCAHVGVELDWNPGQFFDEESGMLICSTHGAMYQPENGECRGGPCSGRGLERLAVEEREGAIFLKEAED